MQLKLGTVYTLAMLAEWFGVRRETMSRQKQKYLNYLKLFADYEPVGKTRVRITKIINPEFNKEKIKEYNIILQTINDYWQKDGEVKCRSIANTIISKYYGDMTEQTILVSRLVYSGQISKEEGWEVLQELTSLDDDNKFLDCHQKITNEMYRAIIKDIVAKDE